MMNQIQIPGLAAGSGPTTQTDARLTTVAAGPGPGQPDGYQTDDSPVN